MQWIIQPSAIEKIPLDNLNYPLFSLDLKPANLKIVIYWTFIYSATKGNSDVLVSSQSVILWFKFSWSH